MPLDLQYDLVNYTPADSSPVEANFNRTQQYINTELIDRTGTTAMTGQLQLVGDPVADLDAAPKQYVDSFVPIAAILMYGGAAAPAGGKWALCNGAELEQAAYPVLFARIGQTYGGTAGHFNLPQLSGRFPIGAGVDALAASGGSRDAIVPAHSHPIDHTHPAGGTGDDNQHHTHNAEHGHGVVGSTGGRGNQHYHPMNAMEFIRYNPFAPTATLAGTTPGSGVPVDVFQISGMTTSWDEPDHGHGVAIASGGSSAITTGGVNNNHQHPFQTPTFAGNSGGATGAAASTVGANMPPFLVINFIIRIS